MTSAGSSVSFFHIFLPVWRSGFPPSFSPSSLSLTPFLRSSPSLPLSQAGRRTRSAPRGIISSSLDPLPPLRLLLGTTEQRAAQRPPPLLPQRRLSPPSPSLEPERHWQRGERRQQQGTARLPPLVSKTPSPTPSPRRPPPRSPARCRPRRTSSTAASTPTASATSSASTGAKGGPRA